MVSGRGMNVDVEERGVAVEESLPEGQHGKGTSGEKHESDLWDSPVRVILFLGHQGSPPEKLFIGEGVDQLDRMKEIGHVKRIRNGRGL